MYPLQIFAFSPEFWRQSNIVKCSRGAEAEANHNVGCPRWAPNVTCSGKNIGLDRDSNKGPQEYRSCTLPLSYRTTCR